MEQIHTGNQMMSTDHPITPPPELVRKWNEEAATAPMADQRYIATQAARWGADQELEACCEWVENECPGYGGPYEKLRAARRPKPPSLNEVALQMLSTIERDAHYLPEITDTIRRALEQLDD
jgi:hypothetical protein